MSITKKQALALIGENANADIATDRNGYFLSEVSALVDAIIEDE